MSVDTKYPEGILENPIPSGDQGNGTLPYRRRVAHLEVLARQLDLNIDVKLTCDKSDISCSTTSHSLLQFVEFVCAQNLIGFTTLFAGVPFICFLHEAKFLQSFARFR